MYLALVRCRASKPGAGARASRTCTVVIDRARVAAILI
jgi:hypothetical protein